MLRTTAREVAVIVGLVGVTIGLFARDWRVVVAGFAAAALAVALDRG